MSGPSTAADCYVSSVIVDWVSRGYIVFAPEHADGSAAFTAFPDGYRLPYQPLSPEQRKDRSLEYERRHAQVKQRARELSACIDVAEAAAAYVLPPDGSEGDEDSEPRDLLFIKLLLCDRLDLSRGVCAAGCAGQREWGSYCPPPLFARPCRPRCLGILSAARPASLPPQRTRA